MAESAKYSKKDFMRGLLVLETDGFVQEFNTLGFSKSSLRDKAVSLSVRKAFQDNNITLSPSAYVNPIALTAWILIDSDNVFLIRKTLLFFVIYRDITKQLEAGTIPDTLKADLASVAPVDLAATISTSKPNQRWEIDNGAKNLLVYKDKEFHFLPTFRVYKEDFTLETDLTPGTEIVGTCFYRESPLGETGDPYKEIFPPLMTGVIFKRCNLDNVYMPLGNSIIDADGCPSSHRRMRVQNDLEDWIVDASGNPVEPVNIKAFQDLGLSTDPKDIPVSPVDEPITGVIP